jgi:hypothetical protein
MRHMRVINTHKYIHTNVHILGSINSACSTRGMYLNTYIHVYQALYVVKILGH